jgi:O-antigen/teichoic acid export membrane protein
LSAVTTSEPSRVRRALSGGGRVAVATSAMNVATYGFTIVAARAVGPSEYGAFAACLSLLIVVQVGALGLQATAARRIAVDRDNVAAIERAILALSGKVSLAVGLLLLLLVPAIDALLNLDSLATAAVVAVAAVPLTLAGGQAGILQGERRWKAAACVCVFLPATRCIFELPAEAILVLRCHPSSPRKALGG